MLSGQVQGQGLAGGFQGICDEKRVLNEAEVKAELLEELERN
jgi:hypothetical protein